MIKKIQLRFILFTTLVIGIVLSMVTLLFLISSSDRRTYHRTLVIAVIMLFLVLIASVLLSYAAMKPIRRALARQLDFTADASHELRTPLAVLQSNLEIVMDNGQETVESQMKWLVNMKQESVRMNRMVENLLTLSRADCDEALLELTNFPLDEVMQERAAAFESLAGEHQIVIRNESEPGLLMHGDRHRITQLFTILMDNSIRYMDRAGTITIRSYQRHNHLHILYMDDGAGIPAAEAANVFSRFYRVDRSRAGKTEGSGLGLSIAKWIVEAHEGRISLKSDTGRGVAFHIIF